MSFDRFQLYHFRLFASIDDMLRILVLPLKIKQFAIRQAHEDQLLLLIIQIISDGLNLEPHSSLTTSSALITFWVMTS